MSGPSVDLEKPNVIGGLDRLVTNFAISAIAVFPTFLTCVAKPSFVMGEPSAPMVCSD